MSEPQDDALAQELWAWLDSFPAPSSPAITLEMIRSGVDAYLAWDPEFEEIECLAVAVFAAMQRAKSLPPLDEAHARDTMSALIERGVRRLARQKTKRELR